MLFCTFERFLWNRYKKPTIYTITATVNHEVANIVVFLPGQILASFEIYVHSVSETPISFVCSLIFLGECFKKWKSNNVGIFHKYICAADSRSITVYNPCGVIIAVYE